MKELKYVRQYRPLASTYVTFSRDGRELLGNLGGEQIYLYRLDDHSTAVLKPDFLNNKHGTTCETSKPYMVTLNLFCFRSNKRTGEGGGEIVRSSRSSTGN